MSRFVTLTFLVLTCTACNFLQVKISPDPFYSAALGQNADNKAALFAQGQRFLRQGRYGEGLKYFERLAKLEPGNAGYQFDLGRCYFEGHLYAKARVTFAKAGKIQPSEAALLGEAAAAALAGDPAAAATLAQASQQRYGPSGATLQVQGDIAFLRGDAAAALKLYRQSLEKNPAQPELEKRIKDLDEYLTTAR